VGKKGCGGSSLLRGADVLSSVRSFNEDRILFLQIESERGIANLADILDAGEGQFGGIIIGPTDLSLSMSIPLQYRHPRLVEAIKEVLSICQLKQVSCGLFCGDQADISYWRSEGMNIIWAGTDVGFLLSGYANLCGFIQELD
jgi:2-keto-3-deoxy-L-rhamnonate aldolase RhmA